MIFDTLISLEVPFDVMRFTLSIDEPVRVSRESMHVAVRVGGTTVGEYDHNLMK